MATPISGLLTLEQGSKEWQRLRTRCETDLFWLLTKVLDFEKKIPLTVRAHYALCRFAERRTGIPIIDQSRVQLIHVCRGWAKTLAVTQGRTLQRILADHDWGAGIANEGQRLAEAMLGGIKGILETNEFIHALYPELNPNIHEPPTWKASEIIVPGRSRPNPMKPSVLAMGIDASKTGVHMNEWIVDDMLSEKAAENARSGSYTELEQLERHVIALEALTVTPGRDPITYIGTPWWPGDTYEFIQETYTGGEKYREFLWNLKLPDGDIQPITLYQAGELAFFRLRPVEHGVHLYPERFGEEDLERHRLRNREFYSAQFLLKPTAGGVAQFKPEYLQEFQWEMSGKQLRFKDADGRVQFRRIGRDLQVIMAVDPAISERSTSARTAITVVGSDGERLFLLEAYADRISPDDTANKIVEFFKTYRPTRIIIENVAYQTALSTVLRLKESIHKLERLPIHHYSRGSQTKKNIAIAGLEPYFRSGNFFYHPKSQQDFYEEYTEFSPDIGSRKVDLLDSLSFMKEHWETLGFLENKDRLRVATPQSFSDANARQLARIREHASRKRTMIREWDG